MVGLHHQRNGHEFEQTLGDGEGQGGLACCSPWGHKESDTIERLNNSNGLEPHVVCSGHLREILYSVENLLLPYQ